VCRACAWALCHAESLPPARLLIRPAMSTNGRFAWGHGKIDKLVQCRMGCCRTGRMGLKSGGLVVHDGSQTCGSSFMAVPYRQCHCIVKQNALRFSL
jgi:hypothetical protein